MVTTRQIAFGALLKHYRRAAALTQEALAERAGYSVVYIGMLERGQRLPLPATVQALADALALPSRERALLQAAAPPQDGSALDPALAPAPFGATPHHLVGRARELEALDRHLAGLGPPVLLLGGEPGIGKSRLLSEAVTRGQECGWQALRGGCQRRDGQTPYAPLLDALARYIRHQTPARLRADLRGCAWLVRLLPELADMGLEPLPAWSLPPAQEWRFIVAAVSRLLAAAAGPVGALLVLDDLQWAGSDALDLLTSLVRVEEMSLRVVAAYRDSEVQPLGPLAAALADLAQSGLATHLALSPLAAPEAAQLLDQLTGGVQPALRERLLERAGGVPFFLVSCAQALRAGAPLSSGRDVAPWDVAQGIRQRVAALPVAARELLDVAAVVGRQAPRALLVTVAARPERDALAALEAACHARLLEDEAEHFRFAHDLIREVVEGDLGNGRRMALHRRVAEALARGPGERPVESLAYHYGRGGALEQAALYLEQAGDRVAARAAHAAAEGYYREAIERLSDLGRTADGARVREKLGALLATVARYDAALAVLEQAVDVYRAAEDQEDQEDQEAQEAQEAREGLGRTLALLGRVYAWKGMPEEGVRRLQPALRSLEATGSGPSQGLAALYTALAHLFFAGGRYGEQLSAAERAATMARAVGDDAILAAAQNRRGVALLNVGRVEEARQVLEEAARVAEAAGDHDSLLRALNNTATVYLYGGDFETSVRFAERALAVAEQLGDPAQIAFMAGNCGFMAHYLGHWRQTRLYCERAMAVSRELGVALVSEYPLLNLGLLAMTEGAWDEATRYLEDSVRVAERGHDLQALRFAQSWLAERDVLDGRPEAAEARLVSLLDRPGLTEQDVTILILPPLAWARLEQGETAAAGTLAARAVARARATDNRLALVGALRVQAMVMTRQGRWTTAARVLEEGLSLARRMPYPFAEGRLLYVYGLLLGAMGKPRSARQRFAAARRIFQRLGARKELERTREALDGAQQTGPQRTDAVVTNAQWTRIQALLPPPARTGRRRADDRRTIEAILYVQRTGCAWGTLPAELGDDTTAHRRWRQWRASGVWQGIEAILRDAPGADGV